MMIGALSRRQKVYVWREFEQKRTSLREKREKRERKERERREIAEFSKKKRKKKMKKLSLPSAFCLLPSREQNKGKRASAFPLSENCSLLNTTFYPLSVPTTNNTSHDTPRNNYTRMTDSKRSNAAGEKYALRGIYGSEPYWPQEKLKICVTGAGGFIGETY